LKTLVVMAALALASFGCSGSGTSTDGGSNNPDGGGGNCQSTQLDGLVELSHSVGGSSFSGYLTSAEFPATPIQGGVNFLSCRPGCEYTPRSDGGVDGGEYLGVGTVTASDTTTGMSDPLDALDLGNGPFYDTSSLQWSPGDSLQVTATGDGGFPGFTVNVQAPASALAQSPGELLDAGLVTASVSAGLTVTWAPASPAATFIAVGIDTPSGGINCYAADSAGTLTISSSVLSNLPQGTYSLPGGLTFGRYNASIQSAGSKNIGVTASEYHGASIQLGP
jgi:hypothetical protein